MSMVLSIYTLLKSAAHSNTFSGISFTNIVTIATQSSVFIKKASKSVARQPNKLYAYLVLLLKHFM